MPVSKADIKLLWARTAGCCSAPGCGKNLLPSLDRSGDVILGEMAHVIGRKVGSARNDKARGVDDRYDNLILLCPTHHTLVDAAEADYPVDLLRKWKRDWEAKVAHAVMQLVSVSAGDGPEFRMWAYFNFSSLLQVYSKLCPDGLALGPLPDLLADRIVRPSGFPIQGPQGSRDVRSVFDTWPQDKSHDLQQFYSGMVEQLVHEYPPLDGDSIWGLRKMRALLYPSAMVFVNRRCIFKTTKREDGREVRKVRCAAKGIEITFQVDTWNMYSNSAVTLHFRGNSKVLALLLVRDIDTRPPKEKIRLRIKATPIALGVGFPSGHDRTPDIAWRDFLDAVDSDEDDVESDDCELS